MITLMLKVLMCDGTVEYEFVNENHLKSTMRKFACDDRVAKVEIELAPNYN